MSPASLGVIWLRTLGVPERCVLQSANGLGSSEVSARGYILFGLYVCFAATCWRIVFLCFAKTVAHISRCAIRIVT